MKHAASSRATPIYTIRNNRIRAYLIRSYTTQLKNCERDLLDLEVARKRTAADIHTLRAQIAKLHKAHPARK